MSEPNVARNFTLSLALCFALLGIAAGDMEMLPKSHPLYSHDHIESQIIPSRR